MSNCSPVTRTGVRSPSSPAKLIIDNCPLLIDGLVAGYPGRVLVRNLFLHLPEAAFVAVVGHNGAGKTTLFRVLTGQLPYQGSVRLLGHEVRCLRQAAAAGLLGYLPQRSIDLSSPCASWW